MVVLLGEWQFSSHGQPEDGYDRGIRIELLNDPATQTSQNDRCA